MKGVRPGGLLTWENLRRRTRQNYVDYTLASLVWELTGYGVMLFAILHWLATRFDAGEVIAIVVFLAGVVIWKLVFQPMRNPRYLWAKLACTATSLLFAWYLVYQAENVRAAYFRFHVLQQRLSGIVAKAPAYVVVANCDGQIVEASENIRDLTGYRRDELLGMPVTALMRPDAARRHNRAFAQAIDLLRLSGDGDRTGWMLAGERAVGVVRKDGTVTFVRIYAGGIRWSGEIQFRGDIDTFAIMWPVGRGELFAERLRDAVAPLGPRVVVAPAPEPRTPTDPPPPVRFVPDPSRRDLGVRPLLPESPLLPPR